MKLVRPEILMHNMIPRALIDMLEYNGELHRLRITNKKFLEYSVLQPGSLEQSSDF